MTHCPTTRIPGPHLQNIETLTSRFSLRLRSMLDDLGYPMRLLDRTRQLAHALGLDESMTTAMLSGHLLPDYNVLLAVCTLGSKQPGWFLDADPSSLPEGTIMAHPLGPGRTLAIQIPEEFKLRPGSGAAVAYLRAKSDMGFGVQAGDWVFSLSTRMDEQSIRASRLYLIGDDDGFDVRLCQRVEHQRAFFISHAGSCSPSIMPADQTAFQDSGIGETFHHFGEVIGILRSADQLPRSPGIDFVLG